MRAGSRPPRPKRLPRPQPPTRPLSSGSWTRPRRVRWPSCRDECARTRAAADPDPEATHRRIHRNRYLRSRTDTEGAWRLEARGTRADGARVMAALRHTADRIFRSARAEGRREPSEAYMFDALLERTTGDAAQPTSVDQDTGNCATADSSASNASNGKVARAALPVGADAKIIVRIDHAALMRGHVEAGEVCEISGVGPVPVSLVRDWMQDAFLAAIVTDGVDIRSVVHLGRRPTALQRTALQWRAPVCTRQGCGRNLGLEVDHNTGWTVTHRTELDDLDPLCHHDHDLKTRFGWALEPGKGTRRLLPPDHPDHPANSSAGPPATGPPPRPDRIRRRQRAPAAVRHRLAHHPARRTARRAVQTGKRHAPRPTGTGHTADDPSGRPPARPTPRPARRHRSRLSVLSRPRCRGRPDQQASRCSTRGRRSVGAEVGRPSQPPGGVTVVDASSRRKPSRMKSGSGHQSSVSSRRKPSRS